MMSDVLVSIVTVVLNAEDLVEETILSVIEQEYPHIEFIIVDGGSTDGTIEIIKKYKDNISLFVSEKDNGIYDAMNKAIGLANGKWINFMNAGDSFVNQRSVSSAMNEAFPNTDVLYGDHYYCDGGKKELRKSNIQNVYSTIVFNHQSMFYKTKLLEKYRFDESFSIVADCETHIRAYKDGNKFQYLNIPIANFLAGGVNDKYRINTIIEFTHALALHLPKDKDIRDSYIFRLLIQENSTEVSSHLVKGSNVFDSLKQHIDRLCSIRFLTHPIKKIKRYKQLINFYQGIKYK